MSLSLKTFRPFQKKTKSKNISLCCFHVVILEIIPVDAVIDEHSKYSLQSPGQLNELIEIYLSYIINPSIFWFQCVSMFGHMNELAKKMGYGKLGEYISVKFDRKTSVLFSFRFLGIFTKFRF